MDSSPQATETETLSSLYTRLLDKQVARLLASLQPDGAFQAEGAAYSIYDQNGMYPLALAYLRPGGQYENDSRLLDAILRSGDRHLRELNAQGQWEVITPGGRWGWSYDEWRQHFWLETVLLLGERLGAERLAQWDEGIARAVAGIVAITRERMAQGLVDFVEGVCVTSPNHTAWYALVCRRAGIRYGRPDWVELGDTLFAQMRDAQTPDGFWVEFAAPTVGYNYVSLLAVGVLWEHLGAGASPEWLDCIERGMDAQLHWSYPNGGIVGEIEGRQRYHGPSNHALPAVCARWPRGAAALRATAQRLLDGEQAGHFLNSVSAGFLCETARYLERYEPSAEETEATESVWKARGFTAGWRRVGPWQATLSGLVTPQYESRWRLDIANLVGLYHAQGGLLAGGGHSKHDPEWATFTVRPTPNADPVWLPTGAQLTQGKTEDCLRLDYGGVPVRVEAALSPEEATFRFALEAPSPGVAATARLLRPLAPGTEVRGPDGAAQRLDPAEPIAWTLAAGGEIGIGPVRYLLPPGGLFRWPLLPFNPYNQQDTSDVSEAFAALETALDAALPEAAIRVRVEAP
ncbi:MAG TPA: hypothetical protein VFB21_04715 [Chthonomonadaceae bacterium]|nr:hypothetical protein [Chthonomonadaceae bacterium]